MHRRVLHAFVSAVLATACSSDKPATPNAKDQPSPAAHQVPAGIDTEGAKKLIAAGATVIDVRTADEFADGHLATAKNIPVDEVSARLAEVEQAVGAKDKPVVVYCAAGGRAAAAKVTLEAAGFTHVVNGGGYRALNVP